MPPSNILPTTVMGPLVDNPALEITPPETIFADAVMSPAAEMEAEFTRPLTLAVFATNAPATVVVLVDLLMRTLLDDSPIRTMPFEAPVPASNTRSPPRLNDAVPAACPIITVLRALFVVLYGTRPMVNGELSPSRIEPMIVTPPLLDSPLTVIVPLLDTEPAVTADAVRNPVLIDELVTAAAVRTLLAVMSPAVSEPDVLILAAVMSDAVRVPVVSAELVIDCEEWNPVAVIIPAVRPSVVTPLAVNT